MEILKKHFQGDPQVNTLIKALKVKSSAGQGRPRGESRDRDRQGGTRGLPKKSLEKNEKSRVEDGQSMQRTEVRNKSGERERHGRHREDDKLEDHRKRDSDGASTSKAKQNTRQIRLKDHTNPELGRQATQEAVRLKSPKRKSGNHSVHNLNKGQTLTPRLDHKRSISSNMYPGYTIGKGKKNRAPEISKKAPKDCMTTQSLRKDFDPIKSFNSKGKSPPHRNSQKFSSVPNSALKKNKFYKENPLLTKNEKRNIPTKKNFLQNYLTGETIELKRKRHHGQPEVSPHQSPLPHKVDRFFDPRSKSYGSRSGNKHFTNKSHNYYQEIFDRSHNREQMSRMKNKDDYSFQNDPYYTAYQHGDPFHSTSKVGRGQPMDGYYNYPLMNPAHNGQDPYEEPGLAHNRNLLCPAP